MENNKEGKVKPSHPRVKGTKGEFATGLAFIDAPLRRAAERTRDRRT
jgi:hypothetical protein